MAIFRRKDNGTGDTEHKRNHRRGDPRRSGDTPRYGRLGFRAGDQSDQRRGAGDDGDSAVDANGDAER